MVLRVLVIYQHVNILIYHHVYIYIYRSIDERNIKYKLYKYKMYNNNISIDYIKLINIILNNMKIPIKLHNEMYGIPYIYIYINIYIYKLFIKL